MLNLIEQTCTKNNYSTFKNIVIDTKQWTKVEEEQSVSFLNTEESAKLLKCLLYNKKARHSGGILVI